jgi:corrinoid protein of di/trimethylamine methyltransferase
MEKQELLDGINESLVIADKETCVNLINEGLEKGIATPLDMLRLGLGAGMTVAGDKYESGEYFVPEMLMCVDVMDSAMEILMPLIKAMMADKGGESPGKVVIGVVEGDIHDIGKTITASLLEAAGFEVFDLGRDVPAEDFIKKAKEVGAQVIAASTLMTPTLEVMEELHEDLEEEGMRDQVKTIIGGGATSEEFADEIGADGYAGDAVEGVDAIKRMVEEIKMAMGELEKRVE